MRRTAENEMRITLHTISFANIWKSLGIFAQCETLLCKFIRITNEKICSNRDNDNADIAVSVPSIGCDTRAGISFELRSQTHQYIGRE